MNTMRIAKAVACIALPFTASAHNYSYVEGGYIDLDRGRNDDSGLRIAGSLPITSAVNTFGEFFDTGDIQQIGAGLQWHTLIANRLEFTAGASIENVDVGPEDDTGLGLRAGLRWLSPNQKFEVNPEIRSLEVFNDRSTSLRVAGLAAFNPNFSAVAAIQGGDDDRFELGLRAYF